MRIDDLTRRGAADALARFKLASVPVPGVLDRLKSFGAGQLGAAGDLFRNLRGGLGGQMNPALVTGTVPPQSMGIARATHRQEAMGNLGKLAPSMAMGGLYMWHRKNQAEEEAARRRAMMQQAYPPGPLG